MRAWTIATVTVAALLLVAARPATAGPDVPTPAHPRLLLDKALRASWKAKAAQPGSRVARAVARCEAIGKAPKEHERDLYMGLDWASHLQNCLVAWAATGKDEHADTAEKYFVAMLDDLANVGDGKGGDEAARRDSGFAIRAMGPYTALAYDWLHDRLTEDQRKRARRRFAAWTTWYLASGYRARSPSTNYHAGYLIAVTFIAIAQNGEAGKDGNQLWHHVRDEVWGKDMLGAMAKGGILDGGDWAEGWQYGPLAVAEYAVGARVMAQQGVKSPQIGAWLDDLIRRQIHALSPGAGIFVGGDTQEPTANLPPNFLVPAAVVIGNASPDAQAWALHEIQRLKLDSEQWALFGALVDASTVTPKPVPRDRWPTSYLARGVSSWFVRSHWGEGAVWTVLQCNKAVDADHVHPDAGNLVLSRGADDLIVDPSPYGTLSSLTGNAPTLDSSQFPAEYQPSQAFWGVTTGFTWARQTASGIAVARCDYADQFKFQDNPSDVPAAIRDVVLVPWADGTDATMVVVDRATSGAKKRHLHLRFRAQAGLTRAGDVARGTRGASSVTIQKLWATGGTPEARALKVTSCFDAGVTRGGCQAARFPVDEWRLEVPGPTMEVAHVIDVAAASATPSAAKVERQGALSVVLAERGGTRLAVVVGGSGAAIAYRAPAGRHVVLDAAPDASVAATASKGGCAVTIGTAGGTKLAGQPAVFTLDAGCKVVDDPTLRQPLPAPTGAAVDAGADAVAAVPADPAAPTPVDDGAPAAADGTIAPPGNVARGARTGCCGATTSPGSPIAMAALVLGWLLIGRGRRRSHGGLRPPPHRRSRQGPHPLSSRSAHRTKS